ncbi:tetratricopeptide repeat protein [Limibacter armeniacum]|uniref:tetratricopeptide repeat protein n=1 Tax=Limibacter armeniacum TaxID=466084 RepID=UPI002FE666BA
MLKRLSTLVMCAGLSFSALGQDHVSQTDNLNLFENALDLYQKQKYSAARRLFSEYLSKDEQSERSVQAQYYLGVCDLELDHPEFEQEMSELIEKYPNHSLSLRAYTDIGSYYYSRGDYKKAVKYFRKNLRNMDMEDPANMEKAYQLAYSYFAVEQYDEAGKIFSFLKKGVHAYAYKASYYAGYINYRNGNLKEAFEDLNKASQDPDIRPETYVMIPGIYYQQGKYDQVISFVADLEKRREAVPSDLKLFAGESYFQKKDYEQAQKYFGEYIKNNKAAARDVHYRMGYSLFKTDKPAMSVAYLSKAADGADTLAQVSAYHLGISYIKLNRKELAIAAFDKCRKLEYDPAMQELGAFYYTKVSYDASDYTSTIQGSEFYFEKFPNGTHGQDVYNFSTEAYLNTGDYDKALMHFNKIRNKNRQIKEAYQEIAFNKGVENYNDGKFEEAVNMLNQSLLYPYDSKLKNSAYFWQGEIYSYGRKYPQALASYKQVEPNATEYARAQYGTGYALYNSKEYSKAADAFSSYLSSGRDQNRERKADAHVRLADCQYINKDFQQALRNYDLAVSTSPDNKSLDYIMYQKGNTYRAYGRSNEAVEQLEMLVKNFPTSSHRDKALYQLGNIYAENARWRQAIQFFSKLIDDHKNSQLLLPTYAERALAFKNMGSPEMAIDDYKKILDTSMTSEYAKSAIQTLTEISNQGTPVKDLATYRARYEKENPESTALLKVDYDNAKKLFLDGQYADAIIALERFIKQAPKGEIRDDAYLTLGNCYKSLGRMEESIKAFEGVEGNELRPNAVRRIADAHYALGHYAEASNAFMELKRISNKSLYTELAYAGLMRSYFMLNDWAASKTYVDKIISDKMRRYQLEAELYRGKILVKQKKYDAAIVELNNITTKSDSKYGAEAQYLIGLSLRLKDDLKNSTQELINVRKKYASYSTWVYEAYILIAENYYDEDNTFQAKATLKSVIENSESDYHKKKAQELLNQIEADEAEEAAEAAKDSTKSVSTAKPEKQVAEDNAKPANKK